MNDLGQDYLMFINTYRTARNFEILSGFSEIIITTFFISPISTGFGGLVVRVLVLHLCGSGSNPTVGSFFFFFFRFFLLFFCLSRIRDSGPVRVNLINSIFTIIKMFYRHKL